MSTFRLPAVDRLRATVSMLTAGMLTAGLLIAGLLTTAC